MRRAGLLIALAAATAPLGCSSSSGTCEPGTVRHGYTCYAYDPNDVVPPTVIVDPPTRTRAVGDVRLTTSEPATIYYTTDGSTPTRSSFAEADRVVIPGLGENATVAFFAVDLNGNASTPQTFAWDVDRTAPGAPTPVTLTLAGAQRTVTWSPPTDPTFRGVLVARVEGVLNVSPQVGHRYAPGDQIAPGVVAVAVVANGFAGTFTESRSGTPVGLVRYALWSFDDILNYSPAANAYGTETLPAQTGSLSVASATGVVTATQPANIMFAASSTLVGNTLTIKLDVTNATSRVLFAPKLVLTTAPADWSWDDNDGTLTLLPYRALGAAIPAGGKASTTLQFSNVTSGDVRSLPFEVRNNRIMVAGAWEDGTGGSALDETTEDTVLRFAQGAVGAGGQGSMYGGGITVDGRVVMGCRTSSELVLFDLATGKRVLGARLSPGKSSVPRLTLDRTGGSGYALVGQGHNYAARNVGVSTELVRFDAATLRETGRISIGASRNRDLTVSHDGKLLAIATSLTPGGVIIVDLGSFRLLRIIDVQYSATAVHFTADNASLIVAGSTDLDVYKLSDFTRSKRIALPFGTRSFSGGIGGDGRFWLGRKSELLAINLTTEAIETFNVEASTIELFDGKVYAGDNGDSNFARYDMTGTQETSLNFDASAYGHWIGHSPF